MESLHNVFGLYNTTVNINFGTETGVTTYHSKSLFPGVPAPAPDEYQ